MRTWDEIVRYKDRFERGDAFGIVWTTGDVMDYASDMGATLSPYEARLVLDLLVNNYDPAFGVGWETVSGAIRDVIEARVMSDPLPSLDPLDELSPNAERLLLALHRGWKLYLPAGGQSGQPVLRRDGAESRVSRTTVDSLINRGLLTMLAIGSDFNRWTASDEGLRIMARLNTEEGV